LSKTIEDYIKIYKVLDKEFCDKIREELKEVSWKQHEFYNPINGTSNAMSGNRELDVSWDDIPSRAELTQKVWETISQYILTDMNKSYYNGWSGFTHIRFNRYHPDRLMALHCDHIHSMFDGNIKGIPTLTILGSLNDDYEGGEFLMFDEGEGENHNEKVLSFVHDRMSVKKRSFQCEMSFHLKS
jgi:predicted 2-oxoglutarate/Fe(II)-dependent dioxygenase YbiX